MCDFEDWPIISKYTRDDAVRDGVLVEFLRWNGYPVMATTHIRDDFGLSELLIIWHEFQAWKDTEGGRPYKDDRIFTTVKNGRKVWVIEDIDSFTVLYPEDY